MTTGHIHNCIDELRLQYLERFAALSESWEPTDSWPQGHRQPCPYTAAAKSSPLSEQFALFGSDLVAELPRQLLLVELVLLLVFCGIAGLLSCDNGLQHFGRIVCHPLWRKKMVVCVNDDEHFHSATSWVSVRTSVTLPWRLGYPVLCSRKQLAYKVSVSVWWNINNMGS